MNEIIAIREFCGVTASGEHFSLCVQVGRPYEVSTCEWRCPVELGRLVPEARDACGADSWQALQLAISYVHLHLRHFLQRGGRLYLEGKDDGSELDERGQFKPGDFPDCFSPPAL